MKSTIDMARKVDPVTALLLDKKHPQGMSHDVFVWFLEKFADLVAAQEREDCAKVCESYLSDSPYSWGSTTIASAIRARGTT